VRVLAAPDKFRGSASASVVAHAIALGAARAGWECRELPLADGGEGTLDALGGANRATVVSGPLGRPVEAEWRLDDGVAVIEAARASGLALVAGHNDPVAATSRGTGELIAAALAQGARAVVVGVGGSATTDGGLGAVEALAAYAPFGVPVRVACDVATLFLDAARVFGAQKGATPAQLDLLSARLEQLVRRYRDSYHADIALLPGSGAAGGLAGGLAALGAELVPGFALVADVVGFEQALAGVELVITGEGSVDATSFAGKVVGGVLARAEAAGLDVLVVAGAIDRQLPGLPEAVSLVERFGSARAFADTAGCVADAVAHALAARAGA
jgi:glycerate kinase